MATISQPQSPWRNLPTGTPSTPWYQYLTQGGSFPQWQGPSNLPFASAQSWNKLVPSEQQGLQGLAQTMGVYWPDYYKTMSSLWPKWAVPNSPRFSPSWW